VPLAGKAMLLTSMDIDPTDEADFNRWYIDGIISMHLIESDPALSRPIDHDPAVASPGAGDWFVLIDGTDVNAISEAMASRFGGGTGFAAATPISAGTYRLMWDLAKCDISLP
jgi:hypothetical protein